MILALDEIDNTALFCDCKPMYLVLHYSLQIGVHMKMASEVSWGDAILSSLHILQQKDVLCDYTLASKEGSTVRVHSCVLAAVSPILHDLIINKQAFGGMGKVLNCSDAALKSFVKAMYTGELLTPDVDDDSVEMSCHYEVVSLIKSLEAPMPTCRVTGHEVDPSSFADADDENTVWIVRPDGASGSSRVVGGSPSAAEDTLGSDNEGSDGFDDEGSDGFYDSLGDCETWDGDEEEDDSIYSDEEISIEDIMGVSVVPATESTVDSCSCPQVQPKSEVQDPKSDEKAGELHPKEEQIVDETRSQLVCDSSEMQDTVIENETSTMVIDIKDIKDEDPTENMSYGELPSETCAEQDSSEAKGHVCATCGKSFNTASAVKRHCAIKHAELPNATCAEPELSEAKAHMCATCGKSFSTASAVKRHCAKEHTESGDKLRFKCNQCPRKFKRKDQLKVHKVCHYNKGFHCKECKQIMSTRSALKRHIENVHLKLKPFQCRYCQRPFAKKAHLISHEEIHSRTPATCPHCKQTCLSKESLERHLGKCKVLNKGRLPPRPKEKPLSRRQEHLCTLCGKVLLSKESFTRHLKFIHEGVRPFSCRFCNREFTKKSRKMDHENLHTGATPFMCVHCGRRFRQKETWQDHEREHVRGFKVTREKKHPCSFCGKKFETPTSCMIHERKHTGERPFQCSYCAKAFTTNSDLTVHSRSHTGERPYQCEQCDKSFTRLASLKNHRVTHSKVKPFKCTQCAAAYTQQHKLKSHIKKHHSQISSNLVLLTPKIETDFDAGQTIICQTSPNSKNIIVWDTGNTGNAAQAQANIVCEDGTSGENFAVKLDTLPDDTSPQPMEYMVVYMADEQVNDLQSAAEGN